MCRKQRHANALKGNGAGAAAVAAASLRRRRRRQRCIFRTPFNAHERSSRIDRRKQRVNSRRKISFRIRVICFYFSSMIILTRACGQLDHVKHH